MASYFGQQTLTSNTTYGTSWARNKSYVTGFSCPGSGNQVVKEISAYVARSSTGNMRLAVYNASHALMCQGNAEKSIAAGGAWQGHTDQSEITPNPTVLVGGTQYDIAVGWDATTQFWYVTGASDAYTYADVDKTGGFNDPLADGTNMTSMVAVRCGVDPETTLDVGIKRRVLCG